MIDNNINLPNIGIFIKDFGVTKIPSRTSYTEDVNSYNAGV